MFVERAGRRLRGAGDPEERRAVAPLVELRTVTLGKWKPVPHHSRATGAAERACNFAFAVKRGDDLAGPGAFSSAGTRTVPSRTGIRPVSFPLGPANVSRSMGFVRTVTGFPGS